MIARGLHVWSSHELTEAKAAKISSQTEKVLLLTPLSSRLSGALGQEAVKRSLGD